MAVGTNNIALSKLRTKQTVTISPTHAEARHRPNLKELLAPCVIELHHLRRIFVPAIRTRLGFMLVQNATLFLTPLTEIFLARLWIFMGH